MMQAILMSMKQKWWDKILSLEKDLEIRKNAPTTGKRDFTWPLTVLVYVSGTGAIQGKFTCPGWIKTNLPEMLVDQSCVPLENLRAYAKGGNLYGWMVQNPEKFDEPAHLAELGLTRPPVSWRYVDIPDGKEPEQ